MRWFFLVFFPLTCFSAPVSWQSTAGDDFSLLKMQLKNQEGELSKLRDKIATQSEIFDALRQDMDSSQKKTSDPKILQLQNELALIKTNTTQLSDSIGELRKKTEEALEKQNGQISQLEKAINTMMDALGIKPEVEKVYVVKNGDSLGGIAQKNQTTIEVIKKLNNMTNDKIVVGKKLKLPS